MRVPNQPYGRDINEDTSMTSVGSYIKNYVWQPLAKFINAISFGSVSTNSGNIDGQWITVFFNSANSNTPVAHTLNRVPSGYIVMSATAATSVYIGDGTWTSTQIFLKSNTANVSITLLLV